MTETYYINIKPNRITVRNIDTGEQIISNPSLKFGNSRLLIEGEEVVYMMIKNAIKQLSKKLIRLNLSVIIHPFHPEINSFTKLENESFINLGERLGASNVYIMKNNTTRYSDEELKGYLRNT